MRVQRYRALIGYKMVKVEPRLHAKLKRLSKQNNKTISEMIEELSHG